MSKEDADGSATAFRFGGICGRIEKLMKGAVMTSSDVASRAAFVRALILDNSDFVGLIQ